jgi:hypothetical protein
MHEPSDELKVETAAVAPRRRWRPATLLVGIALGILLALAGVLAVVVTMAQEGAPLLTQAALDAARARWNEHGPASYVLDLEISGARAGRVQVEVRVTRRTRDGRAPSQRRTWEYWSVPNQFATLAQDMRSAESPRSAFGVDSPEQVLLRARFDPRFGYPAEYQRSVLGADLDVGWRITHFEVVSP